MGCPSPERTAPVTGRGEGKSFKKWGLFDGGLPPFGIAAFWLVIGLVNAWYVGWVLFEISLVGPSMSDWDVFSAAAAAVGNQQSPYVVDAFRWSPVAAYLLIPLTSIPFWSWVILHFVAVAALPDRRIAALLLISAPFIQDVSFGNLLTFSFVLAWLAIRGGAIATWAFLSLALLVPRPLYVPIVAWLLWQRPEWRLRFAVLFLIHGALVLATGFAVPWIARLIATDTQIDFAFNLGPSRLIGPVWLIVAIPLATWLTRRGRLGLASLMASPYWLPYYFMFPLLELGARSSCVHQSAARTQTAASRSTYARTQPPDSSSQSASGDPG